ncbi:phospholipid-transporting ATPase ABCA3-like [Ixodes scapularis]
MEGLLQLSVLLWKQLYVQRLRARPVSFVLEVLVALVPFANIHNSKGRSGKDAFVDSIIYPEVTPDLEELHLHALYFGPDNSYTRATADVIKSTLRNIAFRAVDDEEEMARVVASANVSDRTLGLFFRNVPVGERAFVNLDYVVMFSFGTYHILDSFKTRVRSGPSEYQDEMSERLTAVQAVVEAHHVRTYLRSLATVGGANRSWPEISVKLRQFPYPMYHEDEDNTMFLIGIRWGAAFIVPFCYIITRVMHERHSGMLALTRLMGLRRSWTWLVHYVCFMLTWTLSCVLVLALMTLVEGSQGVPFVYLANPMLVFVAMMLFASAYVLFGMLISLFFDKSSLAVAFGLLLWSATLVVPFLAWHWNNRTLTAYLGLSRWVKLATSLIPVHGLYYIFRIIELYDYYERKFDWPMIYKYALLKDNVLPFEIILIMGSMSGLFGFLIWYLEMVLPWTATIPEPLHFPFKASYWNVAEEEIKLPASHESIPDESQDNFEEEPRHLLLVVEALNISKVYSKKHAVDHLTLRLYHGQILVLLGHNGAGKTTLVNMLTGMLRPTSGTAIIEGFDLTKDLEDALVNVRLCPQKNLLYEQMTVYEHLFFFAAVRCLGTGRRSNKPITLLPERERDHIPIEEIETSETF